jgi:hypothetical protein
MMAVLPLAADRSPYETLAPTQIVFKQELREEEQAADTVGKYDSPAADSVPQ